MRIRIRVVMLVSLLSIVGLGVPACGGSGGGGGGGGADSTAPLFRGVLSIATAGGASVRLDWAAGTDESTTVAQLVYDVFVAATSGGHTFAAPILTTGPGATSAVVTSANSGLIAVGAAPFFVVRARDLAGNRDANTVEASTNIVASGAVAYVSDTAGGAGTLGDPSDPFPTISAGVAAAEGAGGGVVLVDAAGGGTSYNEEVTLTVNATSMALFGGFARFSTLPGGATGAQVLATRDVAGRRTEISGAGLLPLTDNDLLRVANMGCPTTIDGFDFVVPARTIPLTGTLTINAGEDFVDGVGTLFETELRVGDLIQLDADAIPVLVEQIDDDTNLDISPDDNEGGYVGAGGSGPGSRVVHDAGIGCVDANVQITGNRLLEGTPVESDTSAITMTSSLRVNGNEILGFGRDGVRLGGGVELFEFRNNSTDVRVHMLDTFFSASQALNVPSTGCRICISDNVLQSKEHDFDSEDPYQFLAFAPATPATGGALSVLFERNEMRAIDGRGFMLQNLAQVGENGSATLVVRDNLFNGVSRAVIHVTSFPVVDDDFPPTPLGDPTPGVTQNIEFHDNVCLNNDNVYFDAVLGVSGGSSTTVKVHDNFFSVSESELVRVRTFGGLTDGTSDMGSFQFDTYRNVHFSGGEDLSVRTGAPHGGTANVNFWENTITGSQDPCIQCEFEEPLGTTAAVYPAPSGLVCFNIFNNHITGHDDEAIEYRVRNTSPDQVAGLYIGHNYCQMGADPSDPAIDLDMTGFDSDTYFNTYALVHRNVTGIGGQDSSETGIGLDGGGNDNWTQGGRYLIQNNLAVFCSGGGFDYPDRGVFPQFVNNTVAFNGQALQGGIEVQEVGDQGAFGEAQAFITNCLVAFNNTTDLSVRDHVRASYTLTRDGSGDGGFGNLTGEPFFTDPLLQDRRSTAPSDFVLTGFTLLPGSPAVDAGDPRPEFNDPDNTRNDIGAFGGPGSGPLGTVETGTMTPLAYLGIFPTPYLYSGGVLPPDASTISFLFNFPVNPATISAGLQVLNDGVAVPGTFTVKGCLVEFAPTGDLTPGVSPIVEIKLDPALRSTTGNELGFASTDCFAVRPAVPVAESEPNDDGVAGVGPADFAAAQATGLGAGEGVFRGGGIFPLATDVDVYSFTATAGERIMSTVLDSRLGGGASGDVHLDLYDATGTLLVEGCRSAFNPDYTANGDPYLDHVAAVTGTYFIVARPPAGLGAPMLYELNIVKY